VFTVSGLSSSLQSTDFSSLRRTVFVFKCTKPQVDRSGLIWNHILFRTCLKHNIYIARTQKGKPQDRLYFCYSAQLQGVRSYTPVYAFLWCVCTYILFRYSIAQFVPRQPGPDSQNAQCAASTLRSTLGKTTFTFAQLHNLVIFVTTIAVVTIITALITVKQKDNSPVSCTTVVNNINNTIIASPL
jgi:hypothetical protein